MVALPQRPRRVLIAWELGGGAGHLVRHVRLAQALATRGVLVTHAASADALGLQADRLLAGQPLQRVSAPARLPSPVDLPFAFVPNTYPEILLTCGYGSSRILEQRVRQWKALLQQAEADVVVIDSAPAAALAAISVRLPSVWLGHGYEIPPPLTPMPPMVGDPHARSNHEANERIVLRSLQSALRANAGGKLESVSELFTRSVRLLTTYAPLDHYADTSQSVAPEQRGAFIGPIASLPGAESYTQKLRAFASSANPKWLLYGIEAAAVSRFRRLLGSNHETAALIASDSDPAQEGVHWLASPCDLDGWIQAADVVLSSGGQGVVAQAAHSGKPQWVCPTQREQALTGRRVAQLGVGVVATGRLASISPDEIERSVGALLGNGELQRSAHALAASLRPRARDGTDLAVQHILNMF